MKGIIKLRPKLKVIMKRLAYVLFFTISLGMLSACSSPEEKAAAYIESAQDLFKSGNLQKAEIEYKNALQINQNLTDAWYGIALIHERRQEWPQAFSVLSKIRELNPKHVDGRIKLAQIFLASNQLDEALPDAKEILEMAPEDARAHALMAAVQFRLENYEGAQLEIKKALKIDPANNEAALVLARIYTTQKQYSQAHEILDEMIQSTPETVSPYLMKLQAYQEQGDQSGIEKVYLMLIDKFPSRLSYQHGLARFYSNNEDIDRAEKIYSNLILENPESVAEKIRFTAFIQLNRSADQAIELLKGYIQQDNDESAYKFALAAIFEQIDKNSDATAIYQSIIDASEIQPDTLEARNKLALSELRSGNRDKATLLIDQVLTNDKNNENALLIKASLNLKDKQYDDAIVDLRTVIRDNPDSIKALSLLARAYDAAGSSELALESYIKAYRANSRNPTTASQLAEYYLRNKKTSQADDVLEESIARGNRSPVALKLAVQTKLSLQEWSAAEKFAKQLQEIEGQQALSQQMLGLVYLGKQQQDESIEAFKKAYELSPSSRKPVVALVRTYVRSGKLEEARSFLNSVLSVHANNVTAHTLLGQLSLYENQPEQAEKYFRKSIEIDPKHTPGYRSLARIYLSDNQPDKAVRVIIDALEVMPENPVLRITLASIYENQKDYNKAIGIYENLLKKNPDLIIARNNLASLLTDHRKDEASLSKARSIVTGFSDSKIPHFRDTYAWAQVNSGLQLEQAISILEGVVKEVKGVPVFRYHLGKAYEKKGDLNKAVEQLELAIELGGKDSDYYVDAMSVINSLN